MDERKGWVFVENAGDPSVSFHVQKMAGVSRIRVLYVGLVGLFGGVFRLLNAEIQAEGLK